MADQHAAPHAEDLSRMEGEYGSKMIGKLKKMDILIIGLRGLGCETAKNLILAGPHSVVVHDDNPAQIADLGSNFYLSESELGQARSKAMLANLIDLNPNCRVNAHTGEITEADLRRFHVVCVCDWYPLDKLKHWNQVCRTNTRINEDTKQAEPSPIVFINAVISGVTGSVFADFGDEHVCYDDDGVAVRQIVVDNITNAENGVVTVDAERGHMLRDGDLIKFEEVRGMSSESSSASLSSASSGDDDSHQHFFKLTDTITDINTTVEIKSTKHPKRFLIGNTTKLGQYAGGGIGVQVKRQTVFKSQSLAEQVSNPTFISGYMDFSKFGRDAQLHVAYQAVYAFHAKHGRMPATRSEADSNEVVQLAQAYMESNKSSGSQFVIDLENDVIRKVALFASTEFSPMAALFGGIVAQEITKQAGKYTPIQQFFYMDSFELLDDAPAADNSAAVQSRYAHQISLFGQAFQDRLQQQHLFMVGCGALGCEYLKAFAMTGLGVNSEIVVTDDDRIELSNLNRQFLFRRKHVGKPKSKSAAESVTSMNPSIGSVLKAHEIRVETKTEDVFDDAFWERLDFVVNALDNMHARKYVDGKCVFYEKPLFESGTLGTQANTAICLPHKTPSYSEGAVAGEEQGIAKCTLRNFPSDIVHCIEWAREKFDDLFVSGGDNLNSFLEDRDGFFAKLKQDPSTELESLKTVERWLQLSAAPSAKSCVQLAFDEFIANYRNAINDLTHAFPKDARVIERDTGVDLGPFWHGHKRFPSAINFDTSNAEHVDYIFHAANIFAVLFNLKPISRDDATQLVASLPVPEWKFSGAVDVDEKKEGKEPTPSVADGVDPRVVARELYEKLGGVDVSKYRKLNVVEFEKDDDLNHHVDFITQATNLRAFNYQLKPANRAKCRLTAGRIIPALATTTATITGFVMIEVFKYIRSAQLESYRAATINLATNTYVVENLPDPIKKRSGMDPQTQMRVVAVPEGFTVWDKVTITAPDCTLQQFIDQFKQQHHNVSIEMLSTQTGAVLYNSLDAYDKNKKQALADRLQTKLIDLYTRVAGPVFPATRNYLLLECTVEDESGDTGIVPTIKYVFKN